MNFTVKKLYHMNGKKITETKLKDEEIIFAMISEELYE